MCVVVLFNRISPYHIEATAFATYTSIANLSGSVLSPTIGSFISYIFGVNAANL